MFRSSLLPGFRLGTCVILFFCLTLSGARLPAQAPPAPPPPGDTSANQDSSAKPAEASAGQEIQEVSSHDNPTTFKVHVNLVLVRVVVRDSQGKIVPNLKKEGFQLYDNRKLQTISSFSMETLETRKPPETASSVAPGTLAEPGSALVKAPALPQRFVSMVFDDVHLSVDDAVFVRDSATRFFTALAPTDRVSINTTSGQVAQNFTQDRQALHDSLLGITPHSVTSNGTHDCPEVVYYQADLIVNKFDPQALAVATQDALVCAFNNDARMYSQAQTLAQATAERVLNLSDSETSYAYRHLEDVVRHLAGMPGQRVLVLVSPGFLQTTLQIEASELIDRATRANIVINTIDARGLYAPDTGDLSNPPRDSLQTVGFKSSYRIAAQSAQEDVLAELADGTGGRFYHGRNDVDEAMREAGAAPSLSYLLGFSPQNLKVDGRYHVLKVTLTSKQKFNVQARRGYFAPRSFKDPAEAEKMEIQEALFSQEELHDLPVDLQTQYFKKEDAQARIAVLTHLDLKGIHFRKALGRNNDKLTIVTGIFDDNGNLVTGGEKTIEMKLLDTTYDRLSRSGFTVKSSFDVKPGNYLVRLVVRDAEGALMAARNGAVAIPY